MIVTAIKLTHCVCKYILFVYYIFFFSHTLTIYKDVSTDKKKPQNWGIEYLSSPNLLFVLNVVAKCM